jgi:hypothetical protein
MFLLIKSYTRLLENPIFHPTPRTNYIWLVANEGMWMGWKTVVRNNYLGWICDYLLLQLWGYAQEFYFLSLKNIKQQHYDSIP